MKKDKKTYLIQKINKLEKWNNCILNSKYKNNIDDDILNFTKNQFYTNKKSLEKLKKELTKIS